MGPQWVGAATGFEGPCFPGGVASRAARHRRWFTVAGWGGGAGVDHDSPLFRDWRARRKTILRAALPPILRMPVVLRERRSECLTVTCGLRVPASGNSCRGRRWRSMRSPQHLLRRRVRRFASLAAWVWATRPLAFRRGNLAVRLAGRFRPIVCDPPPHPHPAPRASWRLSRGRAWDARWCSGAGWGAFSG